MALGKAQLFGPIAASPGVAIGPLIMTRMRFERLMMGRRGGDDIEAG